MKTKDIVWGDLLAGEVIKKHKEIIVSQTQPNYYLWPVKYTSSDTWVTSEWWVNLGIKLVNDEIDVVTGLEILLNASMREYIEKAYKFIEEIWDDEAKGIFDEEYYYNIIVHLQEGTKIKDHFVNNNNMQDVDKNEQLRKALIRINDEKTCRYVSMKISRSIEKGVESFSQLEEYIMPRMAEFGLLWSNYFTQSEIDYLKKKCLESLEKDKRIIENDQEQEISMLNKRSLWIIDKIAYWAWILGWSDIIIFLKSSPWYWDNLKDLFNNDVDNENFLVWSNYSNEILMQEKSIEMMENYLIDGAIAWTRMSRLRRPD